MGMLRIYIPAISRAAGMFIRIKHAMNTTEYRQVILAKQVHDELNLCLHLIYYLEDITTHLQEIHPYPPT